MSPLYSLIIAQHPSAPPTPDYRLGPLHIEWIDYHSEKEIPPDTDDAPPSSSPKAAKHDRRFTRGTTSLPPGTVHLFRHSPPIHAADEGTQADEAEGADGTLVGVLAVPLWMEFEAFAEWLGAWTRGLEGFRMIRYVLGSRLGDVESVSGTRVGCLRQSVSKMTLEMDEWWMIRDNTDPLSRRGSIQSCWRVAKPSRDQPLP